MSLIRNLSVLGKYDDALLLAAEFISKGVLPAKARIDALHVAFAERLASRPALFK